MTRHAMLVASTAVAVGVLAVCMLVSPAPGHPGDWLMPGTAAAAAVLAVLIGRIAWQAYRHYRLVSHLRSIARAASIDGIAIQELPGVDAAFVAGLHRPQIFWSSQLKIRLEPEELRAVLLHEQYHQLDRAPAKLIVLEAIAPAVMAFASGAGWLARRLASLEIAADRHAREHGSTRGALASALLKMAPMKSGSIGIGFAAATELRLLALFDEQAAPSARPPAAWLLAPLLAAAWCVLLVLPR